MRFRLLGPLEIFDGSGWTGLGAAKVRMLLAVLLIRANQVVAADELIDQLWPRHVPRTAANLLHQYVRRLRRALRESHRLLVTRAPGYQLVTVSDDLDVGWFGRLVERGHAAAATDRATEAVQLFRDALRLWRGPALVDIPRTPLVTAEAMRLEELRLVVLEERIAADLACGHHANVVGELRQLVGMYPLRERFWSHLLRALHRSGRRSEAVSAYRDLSALLEAELGVHPGAELRELHREILGDDSMPEPPVLVA